MQDGALARAFGLTRAQSAAALGAVRAVVEADGVPPGARSARLLEVAARALGVADGRAEGEGGEGGEGGDGRAGGEVPELARAFPAPAARRALCDALLVAACIEGEVTAARRAAVRATARRLGVRSPWVDLLGPLGRRDAFAVKRALVTRSPDARRLFARTWQEEGALGLWRAAVFALGLHRDAALAARYRALGGCPVGSFGRAVSDHFAARGLAFPGEKGGMPERMLHHDLMHVLNGYDTDPAGECELAGFYAGSAGGDAFTFVAIALATFHLGLRVSPAVVMPARGAFDPERVLAAYLRGRRLRVDVMGQWDYWALMPLPIEEVRARLGVGRQATPDSPPVGA
ncbi:MAG TPA: hypothetical protein VFS43_25715 [Polyangiaceae bacterium]|nr:hypothetical protein [Polyangiaceae bacterium]